MNKDKPTKKNSMYIWSYRNKFSDSRGRSNKQRVRAVGVSEFRCSLIYTSMVFSIYLLEVLDYHIGLYIILNDSSTTLTPLKIAPTRIKVTYYVI